MTSEHISYSLRVMDDDDANPRDYDCYDDDVIDAWERNEWQYVGVELVASRDHSEGTVHVTTEASDSLWAIEYLGDERKFMEFVLDVMDVEGVCQAVGVPVPSPSEWKVSYR